MNEFSKPWRCPPRPRLVRMPCTRSWIRRRDGKYAGEPRRLPRSYLPMAYSISDDYLKPLFDHVVSAKGDSKHYRDGRGIT